MDSSDGRALAACCCALMETAAVRHAELMGFGVGHLNAQGLTWVLARLRLNILGRPAPGEDLRVKTWPVSVERLFRRDFLVRGADGRDLVRAVTAWAIMDLSTRRPRRIPEIITGCTPPQPPEEALQDDRMRLDSLGNAPELASFTVRPEDIDWNRHVNYVRYVEWMLEQPPVPHMGKNLSSLRVLYRTEALLGETLTAKGSPGPAAGEFMHALCRVADGQELVRAMTLWI
jgi:acyl-ACP thioesterase